MQVECCKVEGLFYERVHALECEFAEKFKPLFEKVTYKFSSLRVMLWYNRVGHLTFESLREVGHREIKENFGIDLSIL